jgi:hypothetical protein
MPNLKCSQKAVNMLQSSVAYTCGEDGQVKSWKLPGDEIESPKSERKRDGKARKHRFQPY